jgi:hypothetical protein
MSVLNLPVSFGEALDKLTILKIKLEKIKDDRKIDVQNEYDAIYEILKDKFTDDIQYHYSILKDVNQSIWDMQDIFRESTDQTEKIDLCMKIIDDNDRRFRIKKKLNILCNSHLREQKGYIAKKAFVLSHLGMGDCFTISSAVRFLSTKYEEVTVVCKKRYEENIRLLYKDDPNIIFHIVNNDEDISPRFGCPIESFIQTVNGYDVYMCGFHLLNKPPTNMNTLPFCFYNDIGVDYSIFWKYFHAPTTPESMNLYKLLSPYKYIIIHNQSGTGLCFTDHYPEHVLNISKDTTIFINLNKNIYPPTHPYYTIANEFVNKPIVHYKDALINADYVLLCDSSIFCFAMNLPIRTNNCYVVSRSVDYSYIYSSEFAYPGEDSKAKFTVIKSDILT